jgi:hypothetical protein
VWTVVLVLPGRAPLWLLMVLVVVISIGGYAWAEGINAVSFLAVVGVLLTLTLPGPTAGSRDLGIVRSITDGFRFVSREPGLRVNALAMCLNTFLAAPFIALVPAMAENAHA